MTREEFDAIARHRNHADPEVCGFCKGLPVGNAATWVDGKPRPPAACPRCGETNYPVDWPNNERHAA
jgi:hypothetical protein